MYSVQQVRRMNFMITSRVALTALTSLLAGFSIAVSAAPADDDFLLMIPALIAASQNRNEPAINPLDKVKELQGDWIFSYPGVDSDFDEEFRFYVDTAKTDPSDGRYASIDGAEYAISFSVFIANNLYGAYNAQDNVYAVFHQWGPPKYDSGSMFFFRAASGNTPGFDCHFFTDGDGNIDDYYAGYGGSDDCEPLSKSKVSSQAQTAQSPRYVDYDKQKAAKCQIVLERRNVQAASAGVKSQTDRAAVSDYQNIYEFITSTLSSE